MDAKEFTKLFESLEAKAAEPDFRYLTPDEWKWLWQEHEELGRLDEWKSYLKAQGVIPEDPRRDA